MRRTAGDAGPHSRREFFCECPGLCGETLALRLKDYDRVRRKRRRLLVRPGHENAPADRVIAREDGWLVVERPRANGRARA